MTFRLRLLMVPNRGPCQWIGVVVVVALFAWTGQSAKASCGDYLYGHESLSANSDREARHTSNEGPAGSPSERTPQCSGPSCHAVPAVPFELPKTSFVRITVKELCQSDRLRTVGSEGWYVIARDSLRPTEPPAHAPLERPPRIV